MSVPVIGFPEAVTRDTEMTLLRAPFAPGLVVAFGRWRGAMVPVSPLATGKGRSEAAAIAGCLGEMAENLSIGVAAHPKPVIVRVADGGPAIDARALDLAARGDLGSEGCACHSDRSQAALRAVCERVERAALALWWQGLLEPRAVPLDPALVAAYRAGASARRARAWRMDPVPGTCAVLVLTDDPGGGARVIGTAADTTPEGAMDAALREALLSEIALVVPPDHPDHRRAIAMDAALAPRMALLDQARPFDHAGAVPLAAPLAALGAAGHPAALADLTHPGLGLPVLRCVCPSLPSWRGLAP